MQARWLVSIDWNGDGDFSDADEDVTADTLGLSLEHFRDLSSDYAEAARLELELRNDDHRYSPPNSASPLTGKLRPGRRVRVRAAYPFDSFTDAPGTRLADHSPEHDTGFSWIERGGGFEIAPSGVGARAVGAGACAATLDFGTADASFGCSFTRGSGSAHGGLCFRRSADGGFLYVRVTGAAIELRKAASGSDSLAASASQDWGVGASKFLQVVLRGSSIRVFVDDEQVLEASESFNLSETRHGLHCAGRAGHAWNGFGGWASLFYGRIDAIHPRPRRGAQYCYVRALDEMERLSAVTLYTYATAQLPQTSGDVLGHILDYAGVDSSRRRLDAGAVLVPDTFSPAIWGVKALDEIHRLQDEEDGLIYVDGHGFWRLEGRTRRASTTHAAVLATIADADDGANPYFSELVWDDGAGNVENMVFMRIRGYRNNRFRTAWTLSDKPAFAAGETKSFLAESAEYDTVGGQLPPRENVDYEANTKRDGSGRDISSEIAVSYPSAARYNGKGTLVRVTFGATAGYLTLLKMRTLNAITYDDPALLLAEDAASKADYGERIRSIEARWTRESGAALACIRSRLDRRKDPKTALTLTAPNGSRANLTLTLQRGMSDRVRVSYPGMGIDQEFFVEGRAISVGEGWSLVTGTLLLREA